ncbi:retrovirus-related Pol polyprotein from transposon 297 [Trichonephila clavipes]|nr:retrovirus-related Pol polyprotein from transposon 297 [Trichonephila clavipes]
MIRWALKLSEFNIEWKHRPGVQNVVSNVLSRNPTGYFDGSEISCAVRRALALNSREQLIPEQREDPDDNGPQFIPDVFEHLSHRLDIKHIKTVTYQPQANLTERVNRTLVQRIACFVEENHYNWDRFLHEFSFALRTAVSETTGKTPAELFLGQKIITPFRKLVLVTDGAEYAGGNIEKLFDEAGQNMKGPHKMWEKYYNQKRRAVNIKVNDLVWVQTHFLAQRAGELWENLCLNLKGPTECWQFKTTI